jgi:cell wall-associated NlpC family hydrolase
VFNGRTTLRSVVVCVAAAALIAPACAAHADPSPEEIQAQIDKGNREVEQIVEQYNKVDGDLAATQASLTSLEADLAPLQSRMDAAQVDASTVAVNAYKTGGGNLRTMSLVLGASSTDAFFDRVGTLEQISRSQQQDLATYTAAKDKFDAEKRRLNEALAAQNRQKAELEARKKQIDGDIARLDEMQRKADEAAKAAAAAAKKPPPAANPVSNPGPAPKVNGAAGKAVSYAWAQLGKKYVWGTAGPNTFDCSGLTMMAWKAAGVQLPHNAAEQYSRIRHISRSQLQPGDLVFYNGLGHVGIYIGNNQIIHAPNSRTVVKVSPIDIDSLYGYGRP